MTHLATADSDPEFAREQIARFEEATRRLLAPDPSRGQQRGGAPHSRSPASTPRGAGSRSTGSRRSAASRPTDGLEPALRWESRLAQVKLLRAGESAGYGRRFVADADTWIGVVPVGYADGFRRDMTGTEVVVEGERCARGRNRLDGRDRRPSSTGSSRRTRR